MADPYLDKDRGRGHFLVQLSDSRPVGWIDTGGRWKHSAPIVYTTHSFYGPIRRLWLHTESRDYFCGPFTERYRIVGICPISRYMELIMTKYSKIFFHIAATCGGCNGIGDMWNTIEKSDTPLGVYSSNDAGKVTDRLWNPSTSLIYRNVTASTLDPTHWSYDPENVAESYWRRTLLSLPQQILDRRDRIWIEILNEPGNSADQARWLGRFMTASAKLAMRDGFRIMGPGWAGGNPEKEAWYEAGWQQYLLLCAQYPDRLAVSLHEYSFSDDIRDGAPWRVGRFKLLHEACDASGIARPTIFITECGWNASSMPVDDEKARSDIDYLARLYAPHDNIKAAFLWTLQSGAGNGNLPQRLNGLMPWLATYDAVARFPDLEVTPKPPPPPTSPPGRYKAIVVKAPQDATEAEWLRIASLAYGLRHDMTASHDTMMAILKAGNEESYVKVAYPGRQKDVTALIEAAGYKWLPLAGLELTEPLVADMFDSPVGTTEERTRGETWN